MHAPPWESTLFVSRIIADVLSYNIYLLSLLYFRFYYEAVLEFLVRRIVNDNRLSIYGLCAMAIMFFGKL